MSWLEDRLGIRQVLARLLSGEVDRRGAWLRTTGMACLVLILVECVTGPILGLYYAPSSSSAFRDVTAIDASLAGHFVRGLHHWSSAALILLAGFTVARMFFLAEYKRRRDVVWIAVVLLLGLVMAFQLTGHILPWDTNAATTADIEAGFLGNVWVVGPILKTLILGGRSLGTATLARWFGIHTLLLPVALLLAVALPLFLHRLRSDPTAQRPDDPTTPSEPYYPFHLAREMAVSLAVFLIVAGFAWTKGAPIEVEATSANLSGYTALSEWYVMPMHGMISLPPLNKPALEPVGTFVAPTLLFIVLILLPFIDRSPSVSARQRPFAIAAGVLTLLGTVGLYATVFVGEKAVAQKQAERIAIMKGEKAPEVDANLVAQGKSLYAAQNCSGCHAIKGQGGKIGPDLTKAGIQHSERDWQIAHLKKPDSKVPGSTMPAYGQLTEDQIKALAEYMVSLH